MTDINPNTVFEPGPPLNKLKQPLLIWRTQAQDWCRRHPRALAASLSLTLGGFALTAFGIAPLAPDAADLPRRWITEEMAPAGLGVQLEALAGQDLALYRSGTTRAGDTAATLLARLGVSDPAAVAFVAGSREARRVLEGRPGKTVSAQLAEDGSLQQLTARFPALNADQRTTHFSRLSIARAEHGFGANLETVALGRHVKLGSGTIRSSLFAATDEARLPDAIAAQLVDIFSGDLDFHRQLRKGDTFSVVYETSTADGEPVSWDDGGGHVLAAEFVNNGRQHQAVWFNEAGGKGGYFAPDGKSKHQAFLASPMTFSRITSGFAMRMHPILNAWRAHLGVDYGAPTGTPVRSVGDGVVDFAGTQNGYGNVVIVRHGNDKTTLYGHLSRIDVRRGQHVDQGQNVGAVGATGWATGPHLHFEFRVHGQHQDPLQVARTADRVELDAAARPRFVAVAAQARSQLDVAETLIGHRDLGD
jgi:murein DD-endopeptidase MepM/ murein hydrolase activator NlpD